MARMGIDYENKGGKSVALIPAYRADILHWVDLAEEVFHMPVRLGLPQHITGLVDVVRNPIHATGVGLLLFGHKNQQISETSLFNESSMGSAFKRMKNWFQGSF